MKLMAGGEKMRSFAVYALNIKSSLLEPPSRVGPLLSMAVAKRHTPHITYHAVEVPTQPNQNLLAQRARMREAR